MLAGGALPARLRPAAGRGARALHRGHLAEQRHQILHRRILAAQQALRDRVGHRLGHQPHDLARLCRGGEAVHLQPPPDGRRVAPHQPGDPRHRLPGQPGEAYEAQLSGGTGTKAAEQAERRGGVGLGHAGQYTPGGTGSDSISRIAAGTGKTAWKGRWLSTLFPPPDAASGAWPPGHSPRKMTRR